jgi:hypothetical protein
MTVAFCQLEMVSGISRLKTKGNSVCIKQNRPLSATKRGLKRPALTLSYELGAMTV